VCARYDGADIRAHLREMYQVEVSPELISRVTDAVVEELGEWVETLATALAGRERHPRMLAMARGRGEFEGA
jgi:hypothetical protein